MKGEDRKEKYTQRNYTTTKREGGGSLEMHLTVPLAGRGGKEGRKENHVLKRNLHVVLIVFVVPSPSTRESF